MDILNTAASSACELPPLFREMNKQGIRELKLSGQLGEEGYAALLELFSFHQYLLRNEVYFRDAPLFKLLSACAKAPRMERLELRDCHLTERDLDNLQGVLDQPAKDGGLKPLGALKSLDLSGDQQAGLYQWKHFFRSLARHAHLQTLSLPDGVAQYVQAQSAQVRQEIARDIASCPQLANLAPPALANIPEIWQAMLKGHAKQQQELLQNVALIARSYPGMHNVALGLTLQAVNKELALDPDNLPKRLDFPPAREDFKMPVYSPTTAGALHNS